MENSLTCVLRLRDDFTQELNKIWKIGFEELGSDYEVLARMGRDKLTTEQLSFPGYAKSRSSVG